jgi:hypothetical protein
MEFGLEIGKCVPIFFFETGGDIFLFNFALGLLKLQQANFLQCSFSLAFNIRYPAVAVFEFRINGLVVLFIDFK